MTDTADIPGAGATPGATPPTPGATDPARTTDPGPSADTGAPADPGTAPRRRNRTRLLLLVAAAVLAADVVSKAVVVATLPYRAPVRLFGGAVYLIETRNPGAAFSFAQGATVVFTVIATVAVIVILRTATRLRATSWAIALGLILGGATGNLVDRLFRSPGPMRGWVVDWISLFDPAGRVFPVFNLADSGIVIGGILSVILAFLGIELSGERPRREERGR